MGNERGRIVEREEEEEKRIERIKEDIWIDDKDMVVFVGRLGGWEVDIELRWKKQEKKLGMGVREKVERERERERIVEKNWDW